MQCFDEDWDAGAVTVVSNHMTCLQGLGPPLQAFTLPECAKITVKTCTGQRHIDLAYQAVDSLVDAYFQLFHSSKR